MVTDPGIEPGTSRLCPALSIELVCHKMVRIKTYKVFSPIEVTLYKRLTRQEPKARIELATYGLKKPLLFGLRIKPLLSYLGKTKR